MFVVVGSDKRWSEDAGTTWNIGTGSLAGNSRTSVVHSGTEWLANTNSVEGLHVSTDGKSWTQRTVSGLGSTSDIHWFRWNGSQFAMLERGRHKVWSSYDGITWTTTQVGHAVSSIPAGGLAWNGTHWVVLGRPLNLTGVLPSTARRIWTSPDAVTWTEVPLPAGVLTANELDLDYHDGTYIEVGPTYVRRSTDLVNWTTTSTVGGTRVAFLNGKWWYVGANSLIRYSDDDGLTWNTVASVPFPGLPLSLTDIDWEDGTYVICGSGGLNSVIWTSPDGVTWTDRPQGGKTSTTHWWGIAHTYFVPPDPRRPQFRYPTGVEFIDGVLYIMDSGNAALRRAPGTQFPIPDSGSETLFTPLQTVWSQRGLVPGDDNVHEPYLAELDSNGDMVVLVSSTSYPSGTFAARNYWIQRVRTSQLSNDQPILDARPYVTDIADLGPIQEPYWPVDITVSPDNHIFVYARDYTNPTEADAVLGYLPNGEFHRAYDHSGLDYTGGWEAVTADMTHLWVARDMDGGAEPDKALLRFDRETGERLAIDPPGPLWTGAYDAAADGQGGCYVLTIERVWHYAPESGWQHVAGNGESLDFGGPSVPGPALEVPVDSLGIAYHDGAVYLIAFRDVAVVRDGELSVYTGKNYPKEPHPGHPGTTLNDEGWYPLVDGPLVDASIYWAQRISARPGTGELLVVDRLGLRLIGSASRGTANSGAMTVRVRS